MAWVEQLESGKYRGFWRDRDGRKRSRSGFTQRAAALRYAGKQEEDVRRGRPGYDPRGITWGDWCPIWLSLRTVEPVTAANDDLWIGKYLRPEWGRARLQSITRSDVQAWVNRLGRSDLSPSSVRRIFYVFSASMKAALRDGHITANPCSTVDLPASGGAVERYLTRGEFDLVLHHLRHPYSTAAVLLVGTGMRFGELAGLHWDRVDLENRLITVAETWDPVSATIRPYPKSKKPRHVPMPEFVAGALSVMGPVGRRCGQVHASKGACRSPLVLTDGGRPVSIAHMRSVHWYPAVKLAGVPHTRLHDLRHTYASWLRQNGVDLEQVQELLGHASIVTTGRYSHLGSTQHRRVLAALDADYT